jgi:hypothetical protein
VRRESNRQRAGDVADPGHIVPVRDCSPETLQAVAERLEVSTTFEHLVYREAELDAIWSLTGFFLAQTQDPSREALVRLQEAAHQAHDLVGQKRPREAAALLRKFSGSSRSSDR